MAIALGKGATISLGKHIEKLRTVTIGLGWAERATTGAAFDLDASALMVDADGLALSDHHFVYYHNLKSEDGSVIHTGDNLVGGVGDADDEQITVDLPAVPLECERIVFAVSIYDGEELGQAFGQVRQAYIRIVNQEDDREIARYDLVEDASAETAMVFGELYRQGEDWRFGAVGQGYQSGLVGILREFGIVAK